MTNRSEIRRFNLGDLEQIELSEEAKGLDKIINKVEATYEAGPAYTVLMDGRIVCCGGVSVIWQGFGEAWTRVDVRAKEHPRTVLKIHRMALDRIIAAHRFHRVQALALASWRTSWRFLEILGFDREGVLSKMGPNGEDFYLYAKVM